MSLVAKSYVDKEVNEFIWNIEDLQLLATNPNMTEMHVFPFTVGSSIDRVSKWKLFLAPDNTKGPLFIALFFQLVEYTGTDRLPVTLKVCIEPSSSSRYGCHIEFSNFTAGKERMKCNFVSDADLTSTSRFPQRYTLGSIFKEFSTPGLKLMIKFEMFGKHRFTISDEDGSSPASLMAREQALSARRHKEVALAMLESGERSDVTFVTRDEQRVPAHRLILSMHSAVFAAMFAAEMKEKTDGVVELVDMGGDALKILLKFVYIGELDDKWGQFYGEIINAAEKYQLTSLTNICDKLLPTLVSWENCVELLKLTELHGMAGAKEGIEKFMRSDPGKLFHLTNQLLSVVNAFA
ncbi:uncharacterized protein LOC110862357 isoform X1 [Folsomia candida]|uniref:uncharacterized protein LOC110862356 isoform X1 n=1 Tax=Folsomia candida TaxID=158441 RepID=UPI000B900E3E|nr:uncharacterized protein LOC110862356 isoform X1 [Folsomia candida]XP_021967244.1 uncharacterized protein LOC110862357 isoform X1 [Folsomia candida]